MIEGGEVLHIEEDIETQIPTVLSSGQQHFQAVILIGYPKAGTFDQCAVYLPHLKVMHPTLAIGTAQQLGGTKREIYSADLHLRNAPTKN
jgi:hypothetical protein